MRFTHIRIFLTVEGIMVIDCVLVQKYEALGKAFFIAVNLFSRSRASFLCELLVVIPNFLLYYNISFDDCSFLINLL